jgi:hypothetical protein
MQAGGVAAILIDDRRLAKRVEHGKLPTCRNSLTRVYSRPAIFAPCVLRHLLYTRYLRRADKCGIYCSDGLLCKLGDFCHLDTNAFFVLRRGF